LPGHLHLEPLIEAQIAKITEHIRVIDRRLAELGDSDEDRIEELLLRAARRHLVEDLKTLTGYVESRRISIRIPVETLVEVES